MSRMTELIDLVSANPDARSIHISVRAYYELRKECIGLLRYPSENRGIDSFMGLPLIKVPFSHYCRNCGAEYERDKCSYCGTPSTIIEVK